MGWLATGLLRDGSIGHLTGCQGEKLRKIPKIKRFRGVS